MHLVAIGGSDAGISAALRARELDPSVDVTVVVADAFPNFSICGIPYYISGEVGHWTNLAHRTHADLEATGMRLQLDTRATDIDVDGTRLLLRQANGDTSWLPYDELVVGTGALSVRPPIEGLDELGVEDGVHLLHSMGDTFALEESLDRIKPSKALIVGAGYVGLEMAEGLTTRGIEVTQVEMLDEVLPTVDPELGHLVYDELVAHEVTIHTGARVTRIQRHGGTTPTQCAWCLACRSRAVGRRPRPGRRGRPARHRPIGPSRGQDRRTRCGGGRRTHGHRPPPRLGRR